MVSLQEFLDSVKGIDKSIFIRESYGIPTLELKSKRELVLKLFNTLNVNEPYLLEVVGLIYLNGLNYNEIAEKIGKSIRTVNRYHKLALHELEREWNIINGKQ